MWYIQLCNDNTYYPVYDFCCRQLIEKHIYSLYDSIEDKYSNDYKILDKYLKNQIITYINNIPTKTIELYVYNYGIDNAIILLNDLNNKNNKNYINTTSFSLLFAIFYNRFTIKYIQDNKPYNAIDNTTIYLSKIIIIQRVWRKVLEYRKNVKIKTIIHDVTYLIEKINKEIDGEPAKKVLIYLVNKFRKKISKTL